jgi:hypothetical protein
VLRLDYLSCLLTVLSTVLVGRKSWTGLAVAGVNSVIICVIGLRTSQLGFIPANLFCIVVYVFSIRSWMRESAPGRASAASGPDRAGDERIAGRQISELAS